MAGSALVGRRWADRADRVRVNLRALELTMLLPTYQAALRRERGRLLISLLSPCRAARSGLKMGSWLPADVVAPWSGEAVD